MATIEELKKDPTTVEIPLGQTAAFLPLTADIGKNTVASANLKNDIKQKINRNTGTR